MSQGGGRIELIVGPMFSGKTSELFRRVKRHVMAGQECLVLKHCADTRYAAGGLAASHDGAFMSALAVESPLDVDDETLTRAEVVAIDEAQFMPHLVGFCDAMANVGKIVLVAALDSTYERAPFVDIVALVPLAERVDKLQAICFSCHASASFSRRIDETIHLLEDVGGAEKYVASCRDCWTKDISSSHLDRNRANASRLKLLCSSAE